jgi:sugar lactone lactonase YvrE
MHGETVYTVDLAGRLETVVRLPGRRPSGLGFMPDGTLLIVSMLERELLRWDGKDLSVHAVLRDLVGHGCNDMVVDGNGRAYVGSFPPPGDPTGVLVLVESDGSARVVAENLQFPNGCVITDERKLVVAESIGRRLTQFAIADDGSLTEGTTFAESLPYAPDGICLDGEGAVWAAMTMGHKFLRIAPGGEVLDTVELDERFAIACALGGPDLRTLFLVSAREYAPDREDKTREGTIHVVDVPVAGAR